MINPLFLNLAVFGVYMPVVTFYIAENLKTKRQARALMIISWIVCLVCFAFLVYFRVKYPVEIKTL